MPQPLLVLNTLKGPLQAVLEIQATLYIASKLGWFPSAERAQ